MNRRAFLKSVGAVAVLGAVPSIGRAQAKDVKVGYILPVTGPLAFEAQLSLRLVGAAEALDPRETIIRSTAQTFAGKGPTGWRRSARSVTMPVSVRE